MKVETKNWVELAEADYSDSLYLYQSARHPNAVYLMCLAIEKLLKAAQIEIMSEYPKKIHHLTTLAKSSGFVFSNDQLQTLKGLTTHYDRVRYRDIRQAHYNTKAKVEPIINQGQTIYLWIHNELDRH